MKLKLIDTIPDIRLKLAEVVDETAREKLNHINSRIACRAGCNHCCSRYIELSVAEAVIIRDYLVRTDQWKEVLKKCRQYNKLYFDYDHDTWFLSNIRCPVLDLNTGLCKAYKVKPVICTTRHAVDVRDACHPYDLSTTFPTPLNFDQVTKNFYSWLVEKHKNSPMSRIVPLVQGLLLAEGLKSDFKHDFETFIQAAKGSL